MEKSISFRVGIIKARFCKALLAQFWADIEKEGTISFRTQWDVASLARLICTLGLRGKKGAEFWNSYVDGGHIGEEFASKALEMIKIAKWDGPLLIFCQLGHLVATAVPLDQSGLEPKDIEKVWELQKKVIDDRHLRLDLASDSVWEAIDQLREQVNDLCGSITGKDREILQRLLWKIDDVRNLGFPGSEGPSQSGPADDEQGPKSSIAVNLTSSSEESRRISEGRSGAAPPPSHPSRP
jgi:hypothetical protein